MGYRRVIAVLLFCTLAAGARAQQKRPGIDLPPVCPEAAKVPVKGEPKTPAARPSAAEARETAEKEAADPHVMVAAEPIENFGWARYRLQDYGDCVGTDGCYWKDLDAQIQRAETALAADLAKHGRGEKLAMVLDIDETTLSSYCEMKREDFGYIGAMFNGWVVTPDAAVGIPGTLRLYKEARAAGVAVFFLTGRPESQRAATENNLRAVGFDGWAGVVLRDDAERTMATPLYKAAERRKMVSAGYKLVMSVGDQWSDLSGLPKAEVSVKLPNPFYYLP